MRDTRRSNAVPLLTALIVTTVFLFLLAGPAAALGHSTHGHDEGHAPPASTATVAPSETPVIVGPDHSGHTVDAGDPAGVVHDDGAEGHGQTGGHGGSDGSAGPANWYVIGGFAGLVGASTVGASATKRRLRDKMLSGRLSRAGVRDV